MIRQTNFPCCAIGRDDLISLGFDAAGLSDARMRTVAAEVEKVFRARLPDILRFVAADVLRLPQMTAAQLEDEHKRQPTLTPFFVPNDGKEQDEE
jgi:hypothetical protein